MTPKKNIRNGYFHCFCSNEYHDNSVILKNECGSGFYAYKTTFKINDELEIEDVNFEEWSCTYNASSYIIDSVSLVLDNNPFTSNNVRGNFMLYFKEIKYINGQKDSNRKLEGKINCPSNSY